MNTTCNVLCCLAAAVFVNCGQQATLGVEAIETEQPGPVPETAVSPIRVDLLSAPPEVTESRNAEFTFAAQNQSPCACRIDDQPFATCQSPVVYTELLRGMHTFDVRPASGGDVVSTTWRVVQNEAFPEIVVMDADAGVFPAIGDGSHTVEHAWLTRQLQPLYAQYPDAFHSVTLFTSFPMWSPSFAHIVQFNIGGIGLERRGVPTDTSRLIQSGSAERLEHVMFIGQLDAFPDDPEAGAARRVVDILAQEFGHRWLAYLKIPESRGWPYALGDSQDAHWNMFVGLAAPSPMAMSGGLIDNEDGTFSAQPISSPNWFSTLELYAMGLLPPEQVEPIFFVNNPHDFDSPTDPAGNAWSAGSTIAGQPVKFAGERVDITGADIVQANGPRTANGSFTNEFPQAFVLLVEPGTEPPVALLEKLDRYRAAWQHSFEEMSGSLGHIRTELP